MTINAMVPRLLWVGTGATSAISLSVDGEPITFRVADHIVVRQRVMATGAITILQRGTHYNITGGPVISSAAPPAMLSRIGGNLPAGTIWAITRATPIAQEVAIQPGGDFSSADVEAIGNRGAEVAQDLRELASRALVQSPFAAGTANLELPMPEAGTVLGWDAVGAKLENKELAFASLEAISGALSDALGYASAAASSATAAANTKTLAEGIYDSFDDRYLGLKPTNPATDNDGNTLQLGTIYFNTTLQELRVLTSAGWVAAYIPVNPDGVTSFNSRTGAVLPTAGDYGVAEITGLQTALDGKAPTTHDHAGQNIVPNTLRFTRATQLPASTDLDTVLVGGFYDCENSVNKPSGSSGWGYVRVEVHANSTQFVKQSWTDLNAGGAASWVRTRVSNVWGPWQRTLFGNVASQTITGGASTTPLELGNSSGRTITPDIGARSLQTLTNNGAFTLAAPATTQFGSVVLQVLNGATAGALTFSGFFKVDGDTVTTANGALFALFIYRITNNVAFCTVKALQ